jgi:GMP reductase
MRIENEVKLDFKDVLIRPKRSTLSSRSEVDISRTFTFRNSGKTWTGVPISASNMDTTGTIRLSKVLTKHKMFTCLHKFNKEEDYRKLTEDDLNHCALSTGINSEEMRIAVDNVKKFGFKFLCMDVANGYTETFVEAVKFMRSELPDVTIIAGNVVTGEMVEELILAGADIIKAGIGPGSACTTRKQTGVGYPQLSAVIECADAAHGLGGLIMADGGCTVPGDIAKAFGAGADFVMLGGMFAGHNESGGKNVLAEDGVTITHKEFYGMSSDTAMKKYCGGVAKYRSSEGKTVRVKYRGPVEDTVLDMLGGLRSACTYIGALKLKEVSKRTTFIRVTQQLNNVFGSA